MSIFTTEVYCYICNSTFIGDEDGRVSKCPKCKCKYEWCSICNRWKMV